MRKYALYITMSITREFFKNVQIALVIPTRAILAFLKNSLVHVFRNCTRDHSITYNNNVLVQSRGFQIFEMI